MPLQKPGSSKQDYGTPVDFLTAVRRKLKIKDFSIDLAASEENRVTDFYIDEQADSLRQQWNHPGWQWCNMPFEYIDPWVMKALIQTRKWESQAALLVPASVGSNWWRDYVHRRCEVLFLNGRLKFVGCPDGYPKDCCLLLYGPTVAIGYEPWAWRDELD